jgi:hypothetical protein
VRWNGQKFNILNTKTFSVLSKLIFFPGSTAQRGLWPPVALQPSAGYGFPWLYSPARAMAFLFTTFLDHKKQSATVGKGKGKGRSIGVFRH